MPLGLTASGDRWNCINGRGSDFLARRRFSASIKPFLLQKGSCESLGGGSHMLLAHHVASPPYCLSPSMPPSLMAFTHDAAW